MALEFLVPIIGDSMAPIMFGCLVLFLLSGYPVAFAVCAVLPLLAVPLVPADAET